MRFLVLRKPFLVGLVHKGIERWVVLDHGVFVEAVKKPLQALLPTENKGALKSPECLLAREWGNEALWELLSDLFHQIIGYSHFEFSG